MNCRLLLAVLLSLVAGLAATETPASEVPSHAVLVTGASTGIGRRITEYLAGKGYFVYAGARKEADLNSLAAIKNVQPIRLDVTQPQEIAAAPEAQITVHQQITQLVQLNEGQKYTYDRDTLIKMLDDALFHARLRAP